ncbi:MAG: prolipoprotein diacylglyceryl transferase [Cyclobacteriaceae bacterium]|nr:prolipoprotein diacylglyceryl transferase [Cyclobacteriaceae bacterium]
MHPVLYEFKTPGFLQGIFPDTISIYAYGTFIALGALFGYLYTARQARLQYKLPYEDTQMLVVILIVAAVLGGKFFIFFENPSRYLSDPGQLFKNFGSGFVFYGSLLTGIPVMIWFFKIKKLPVRGMLDIMAVTTCIVHGMGRMGCFFAGCCYGTPTESKTAVVFGNVQSLARPLHTPLHPTQLYEASLILFVLFILLYFKRSKQFDGQLFLIYLILYAAGRSVNEIFRGDLDRGFVIGEWLSNGQFVSIIIITCASYMYLRFRKKAVIKALGHHKG